MADEIDKTNEKQIGNPNWQKGMESPNPEGRPKGQKNYLTLLEEALEEEAQKAGMTYWQKLSQWCFKNPTAAIAILKKFIPDKNSTEITGAEPVEIVIRHDNQEH